MTGYDPAPIVPRSPALHIARGDARFARLGKARRIWAISTVHADINRLVAIHDLLAARIQPGDRLVYLGNYLGRGGDVIATINEMLGFRRAVIAIPGFFAADVVYLRGAQEEIWQKLLQLQFAPEPDKILEWMLHQGADAPLQAYGATVDHGRSSARSGAVELTRWTNGLRETLRGHDGHDKFFSVLRRAAFNDNRGDGAILLVHSGIDPKQRLDEQRDNFWWASAKFEAISEPYSGFRRVVRGFDPVAAGLVEQDHSLSLDAGAGRGGTLLCACLSPGGDLLDVIEA